MDSAYRRTGYLRALFTKGHTEDGHHALDNWDFPEDAAIPEEHIALDHGTKALADSITEIQDKVEGYQDDIDHGQLTEGELAWAWALQKLIPLSWQYQDEAYAFEMFTESMTMQIPQSYQVMRAVVGDDSLDVKNTTGLYPGQYFILTNESGSEYQVVEIRDVLSKNRVRITANSELSLSNNGWLRGTNVLQTPMNTAASKEFKYLSGYVDDFVSSGQVITLRIRRSKSEYDAASRAVVEYVPQSSSLEKAQFQYTQEYEGYVEDLFVLENPGERFRLVITYKSLVEGNSFSLMYMYAEVPLERTENVHCPIIDRISDDDSEPNSWLIEGSYYGYLYGYPQKTIQAQVSSYYDFSVVDKEFEDIITREKDDDSDDDTLTEIVITTDAGKYVRIRYVDINDVPSRWSVPVIVGPYTRTGAL